MARTKRTAHTSPPASSSTEQVGTEKAEQTKQNPSTSGDETTDNATGSKNLADNNMNSTLADGHDTKPQTQPATEGVAKPVVEAGSTYTFKLPLGISQEQINYKVFKIQSMFGHLTMDETYRMLEDCYYNEDEVTVRLITQNDYLSRIQDMLKTTTNGYSNTDTSSTLSPDTASTTQFSTSPSLHTQSYSSISHFTQQKDDDYQAPSHLHEYQQYQQDQYAMTTGVPPSQLCMAPYQTQHPYYRPLQPMTPFPMPGPVSSASTSTTTPPPTVSPKRGSNYGKKYKKRKATNSLPPPLPSMDDYGSMPPTPIPSSSELLLKEPVEKKRIRSVGRLALDDALKQVKENPMAEQQAYEGWSAARIRAYGLIDANPNTYYYRFNAPGEEQRKGAWTQEEKELFLKRVQEVGANSQWGIFSQAIPGRVGYQCSNFYRLLIETGELFDDNYVVDDKGKAHYLFDKKTATGEIEKTIRNHYKHKKNRDTDTLPAAPKKPKTVKKKKPKKQNPWDTEDDDDDGEYTGKPSKAKTGTRRSTRHAIDT